MSNVVVESETNTPIDPYPLLGVHDPTSLFNAIHQGDLNAVIILLRRGASVNSFSDHNDSVTPLFTAVRHGLYDIAKVLLENGACVNVACGNDHDSPLGVAARHNMCDMAELLLQYKAGIDWDHCRLPLELACWYGHLEVAEFLINHGASTKPRGKWGPVSYMGIASHRGHQHVVDMLERHGAYKPPPEPPYFPSKESPKRRNRFAFWK